MTQNELILRGLELKLDRVLNYLNIQQQSKQNEEKIKEMELGEYVTLTQAWQLQGKIFSLQTLRTRRDLQPLLGKGIMIGKNKCFPKSAVLEWLNAVTPEERKAYKLKYSGGIQ